MEDRCVVCAYTAEDESGPHCSQCCRNYTDQFRRATNSNRIRDMNDEDLARELSKHFKCAEGSVLKWLKRTVS